MNKININNTDLYVSKLSFGTASIHHKFDKKSRNNILAKACDLGITHFDTARLYGHGLAERTLGNYFNGAKREKVTIATKFGIHENPIYESFPFLMYANKIKNKLLSSNKVEPFIRDLNINKIETSLQKSLKSLNSSWIDILYLHEPQLNDIKNLDEIISWLEKKKKNGDIRYFGVAGYVESAILIEKKYPKIFDIFQIEDSLENKQINKLEEINKSAQFSFGYIRNNSKKYTPKEILDLAVNQNKDGSIIVSTNKIEHMNLYSSYL